MKSMELILLLNIKYIICSISLSMAEKRLSLRDRHAIKEGVADMDDSKVFRTKAGKALAEGLLRLKHEVRIQLGLGEKDLEETMNSGNWKMAIWIVVDKTDMDEIPEKVGDVLMEMYKRECKGADIEEKIEQWAVYAKEVYEGVLDIYTENGMLENDFADLMINAIDNAEGKIYEMEFKNKKTAR